MQAQEACVNRGKLFSSLLPLTHELGTTAHTPASILEINTWMTWGIQIWQHDLSGCKFNSNLSELVSESKTIHICTIALVKVQPGSILPRIVHASQRKSAWKQSELDKRQSLLWDTSSCCIFKCMTNSSSSGPAATPDLFLGWWHEVLSVTNLDHYAILQLMIHSKTFISAISYRASLCPTHSCTRLKRVFSFSGFFICFFPTSCGSSNRHFCIINSIRNYKFLMKENPNNSKPEGQIFKSS